MPFGRAVSRPGAVVWCARSVPSGVRACEGKHWSGSPLVEAPSKPAQEDATAIGPDTAPPHVRTATIAATILGRISDNRTPNAPHDWQSITARWNGGQAPMTWYGENLFRATVPTDAGPVTVCAVDAAGNETCSS
jgi:hypothetical protein